MADDATLHYQDGHERWRGQVEIRLEHVEEGMTDMRAEIRLRLDHLHACLERRTRVLYFILGGGITILGFLQILGPLVLKIMR